MDHHQRLLVERVAVRDGASNSGATSAKVRPWSSGSMNDAAVVAVRDWASYSARRPPPPQRLGLGAVALGMMRLLWL